MKRNTVRNILKEFYLANDKVHYISKHNELWNKPAWELKYGVLYHENNLIGKCNSELNIVINYWNNNEIEYRYIYRKGRAWWIDKIVNNYNLSKDSITNDKSDIKSIMEDLLFGIYYRTASIKLKLENYLNRNKYARLKTCKLEYDLCKKALSRIRINIIHWCKKYNIDFDGIYYYDRRFWWGEYIGYRYNNYFSHLKGDTNNIKNILLSQNLCKLLNAKIYYWDNCRNGVLKDRHIPFKKFLNIWKNPNNKKILKEEVDIKIENFKRKIQEREEFEKQEVLKELPKLVEKFRNYEINYIPYNISKYCNEVFIRNNKDGNNIEFSDGCSIDKTKFFKIISLFLLCLHNNITISKKVCDNRKINVDGCRIIEISNSEFWSVHCYFGNISIMEIQKYCNDNKLEFPIYKISKRSIIKKYSKVI